MDRALSLTLKYILFSLYDFYPVPSVFPLS